MKHLLFFLFKVDFANRESQLAFYHCMEKSGQDIRDFYEMLVERRYVFFFPSKKVCILNIPA